MACEGAFEWNDEFFGLIRKYWSKEWKDMSSPEQAEARQVLKGMGIFMKLNIDGTPHVHGNATNGMDQQFVRAPRALIEQFKIREDTFNKLRSIGVERMLMIKELQEKVNELKMKHIEKTINLKKLLNLLIMDNDFNYEKFEEMYEILCEEGLEGIEKKEEVERYIKRKEEELDTEREERRKALKKRREEENKASKEKMDKQSEIRQQYFERWRDF